METPVENYYVWQDNIIEDKFCMLAKELDDVYPNLKKQLLVEKIVLHTFEATNTKEAMELYDKKLANSEVPAKPKFIH